MEKAPDGTDAASGPIGDLSVGEPSEPEAGSYLTAISSALLIRRPRFSEHRPDRPSGYTELLGKLTGCPGATFWGSRGHTRPAFSIAL
ncbi:hypothetical protein Ae717Ps2_7093 [Pseudonocardia sp. Ae717_Ps2]|nr:hypothetical protein Ae717Ps2_7093 [Pseudonocardia sp. Ae717_Ps2]